MKKKIIIFVIIFCLIGGLIITFALIEKGKDKSTMGVWWWNDELDSETYLNFAEENNINEIYYCTSNFDDTTMAFITKANKKNIKVYWLDGKYQWLEDSTQLISRINSYIDYQNNYPTARFSGIHLDIEPHQSPDFDSNENELIYSLIDLASTLKANYPSISFDYDLPFWLDNEITYNNITKPAYEFMIDFANRVFLMSYRDTADGILDISKEEISYAKNQNKQLVLCVETYSEEGDNVSFMEEGKTAMIEELSKLKKAIPQNFGIAIHHIKTWHDLKM